MEQCRALEQIWSHDIWTLVLLNNEVHPPTAARNDKPTSENPLYNDDENEDEYLGDEMSDDAEESEDGDDGSDHMSSVSTDVMERAIETTEQPRDYNYCAFWALKNTKMEDRARPWRTQTLRFSVESEVRV
jgi:hypothetical protein